jgi:sigma-54 dependent transcriptional regulator, acetoin dehydrogenase operon transcriptional activator AcoR
MSDIWKDFMEKENKQVLHQVPSIISSSWTRCKDNGVDFRKVIDDNTLPANRLKELLEREEDLLRIGKKVLEYIYPYLKNRNFILVLTDKEGHVLSILGDPPFMSKAEKIYLSPGSNWSEQSKGTNAVGTVIFEKYPLTVLGWEHYAKPAHFLNCWAAPIFDADQNFVGVLNISGEAGNYAQEVLNIAKQGAKMIEKILKMMRLEKEFYSSRVNFESTAQNLHDIMGNTENIKNDNITSLHKLIKNEHLSKSELAHLRDYILFNRNWFIPISYNPEFESTKEIGLEENQWRGRSEKIIQVFKTASKAALTNSNVIIQGETGTGKEIVAKFIHEKGKHSNEPFIPINCAAIPHTLIESELFGYADGAFTGARRGGAAGKFEEAHNGTLFLDEIGDMPLNVQSTLLRVLQEKCICRIGESRVRKVDVRIIAATNRDLKELLEEKTFRLDLYYRLNVIAINVPPLRERIEDIWDLVPFFIEKYCQLLNKPTMNVSPQLYKYFLSYSWPGNIRELENCIESMIALSDGEQLTVDVLPDDLKTTFPEVQNKSSNFSHLNQNASERSTIIHALAQMKGNITKTSELLGISRATLYRKMTKYNLKN